MPLPASARRASYAVAVVLAVVGVVSLVVALSGRPSEGPVDVVWDGARCERCRMLVSEPAFAAQLHAADGRVFHFDDPGCLLLYRDERALEAHAVWYHHLREPRWVAEDRAVFVALSDTPTPMGYGLGALAAGEAEGLSPAEALARARAVESRRGAAGAGP